MPAARKTVVVQGALAYATRRAAAARAAESGLQILTMPQLAARLAGGLFHQATGEELEHAVRLALDAGGYREIERVRNLPGMIRAITRTLRKVWHAGLSLAEAASQGDGDRIDDMALIEARVKELFPVAALPPAVLRDAALERAHLASIVLGEVLLDGVHFIEPVWRPLLHRLCALVSITWRAPPFADTDWFQGRIDHGEPAAVPPELITCADPRHEVVEALRWARGLLASGQASASQIAISGIATRNGTIMCVRWRPRPTFASRFPMASPV
jgi:hypothetical protein